jgi:hypothetical protein
VRQGPHSKWPGSVFLLVLRWECFVEATSELRDRQSCVCNLLVIVHGEGVQVAT